MRIFKSLAETLFCTCQTGFLGLLGPILSHALETMESKTAFLLERFDMPGTKEIDDCAVTVIKYLYLCQGQQSQWKYELHKLPSVKGSLSFPTCKRTNWCLQLAKPGIGEVCHTPGTQVARQK